MANWPSVQIIASADHSTIELLQTDPTEIFCTITDTASGEDRRIDLAQCAASADFQTLTAQTTWLFFTVNVSIDLALVSPTEATVTINAEGAPTVHQISGQAYADATAFVASCRLPLIAPSFVVGRIKEPH